MKNNDYFDRVFRIMPIQDRLRFYLIVWKKGALKSEIKKILSIGDSKNLEIVAKEFQKNGFLEILLHKDNLAIAKDDAYYYVTEDNFTNIMKHICDCSSVSFTKSVYNLLYTDRANFTSEILENFQERLKSNDFSDQIIFLLMDRSISLFFLYILEKGMLFRNESKINDVFNDFLIRSLLSGAIKNFKLDLFEKEISERNLERPDQEYYMTKQWKKNIA